MVSRIEFPPTERESLESLRKRLHDLEESVTTLTEAVSVLARGLAELPAAEPSGDSADQ